MNVFYFFVEVHVLVHIDGKVRAEWKLEGEINGLRVVATIYDWKESKPLNDVIKWHIGDTTKLVHEPKINGSVTYPENQPSLSEWLEMYRVGVSLPKRVVITKEQISEMFGVNSTELVIR